MSKKQEEDCMKDNIIKFKSKQKFSDSEINGLFLGLVKLVKKMAMEEAFSTLPKEERDLQEKICSLELLLSKQEHEIEVLKDDARKLESRLKVKNLKILQLSCLSAKRLATIKA